MEDAPRNRLYNVDVTISYAAWAKSPEEAASYAGLAVVSATAMDAEECATARLAVDLLYVPPDAEHDGDALVYGTHEEDITWTQAVALDRAADPEAARRCDEQLAATCRAAQRATDDMQAAAAMFRGATFRPEGGAA